MKVVDNTITLRGTTHSTMHFFHSAGIPLTLDGQSLPYHQSSIIILSSTMPPPIR